MVSHRTTMNTKLETTQQEQNGRKSYVNLLTILLPTIALVIGWFVNNQMQRNHDIAQERLEVRLEFIESYFPLVENYGGVFQPETLSNLRVPFSFYAYDDERSLYNEIIDIAKQIQSAQENSQKDKENKKWDELNSKVGILGVLMKNRLWEELGMDKINSRIMESKQTQ